jgi:SMC interacting uncharacterized protein involved in chromosome segregation
MKLAFSQLLPMARYPFAEQINKSNLHAVGSPHAWPSCLAMLIWMVELILVIFIISTFVALPFYLP